MWVNSAELHGVPGFDDDQNGYVDDVYGWNFLHGNNNPMDDNGHGSHVAGRDITNRRPAVMKTGDVPCLATRALPYGRRALCGAVLSF